ncbi:MAG: putative capsular polysaccharide synthesis family protein [Acidimicrobiales bacterium]
MPAIRPSRISALGRPLRRASSGVDRAMVHAETRSRLRRNPIVVYSMGKTGTTSLTTALEAASGRPVVKAHALSPRGIATRLAKAQRLAIVERPRFLWSCEEIARALGAGGRWDLLCGVRDPVALAVSDHFYGLQRQREVGRDPWVDEHDADGHAAAIADNLRTNFIETDWFSEELGAVTGLDVYATPFPHHEGFSTHEDGRFRALVVRAEDLDDVGPRAIASFLGLPAPLPIERRNTGTAGDPTSAYRRFVDRAALPDDLVDAVYATPLARHFYRDDQRARFRARWTGARV